MLKKQQKQSTNKVLEKFNDELEKLRPRLDELNRIIKQLYEDKFNGIITPKRFKILLNDYEDEHSITDLKIKRIKDKILELNKKTYDNQQWLNKISKYSEIKELNREMIDELIEKIVIDEIRINGTVKFNISVYYHLIGPLDKTLIQKLR